MNVNHQKHLSHSQISLMLKCARQYEFRYIERIPSKISPALILGTSYHAALEANFRQKMDTGFDGSSDDIVDIYNSVWNERLRSDDIDWADENPDDARATGERLVQTYMAQAAPFVMPSAVEQRFSISIPAFGDYSLDGVIDLITTDGKIVDHKTASKSKNQSDIDKDLQPYAYAAAMMDDPSVSEIDFEFQTAVKKKTPEIQCLSTKRNRADVQWYIGLVSGVVSQIGTGIFPPNPTGWWCDAKWCPYHDLCKGGAK